MMTCDLGVQGSEGPSSQGCSFMLSIVHVAKSRVDGQEIQGVMLCKPLLCSSVRETAASTLT